MRDRLTPKELRIVALIVQGYKNKEIANQLGTTEQVIKNYLRNVYDKIGVSDRLELALFTIHHRILAEAAAAVSASAAPAELAPPSRPRRAKTLEPSSKRDGSGAAPNQFASARVSWLRSSSFTIVTNSSGLTGFSRYRSASGSAA